MTPKPLLYQHRNLHGASTVQDIHLEDCVLHSYLEEHRVKYLSSMDYALTFHGAFHVHPPKLCGREWHNRQLRKIKTFEYFLWSDVRRQPTFECIKRRISNAVKVPTNCFHFETLLGEKIDYRSIALAEYDKQCNTSAQHEFLLGKPVIPIRLVAHV